MAKKAVLTPAEGEAWQRAIASYIIHTVETHLPEGHGNKRKSLTKAIAWLVKLQRDITQVEYWSQNATYNNALEEILRVGGMFDGDEFKCPCIGIAMKALDRK